ncbi:Phosphatidylethanolamine N-methyltransferase [Gracilaria domingensis]|nr:Phosphatidylethanolamine N-methyltransferase [Gracilaria domingensis]
MGGTSIPLPPMMHFMASLITNFLTSRNFPIRFYRINLHDHNLALAILATVLPPLAWNIIGPLEYFTKIPSRLSVRPIIGVYISGAIIATLSVLRSVLFLVAIRSQPRLPELDTPYYHAVAGVVGAFGVSMFIGAYYRLGICGTYLGDYFGFLMNEKVTAFPFNVASNPMYDGSSLMHLAEAIMERSPAGILLSAWLFFCYRCGCILEEPFTERLYSEREERREGERLAKLKGLKSS